MRPGGGVRAAVGGQRDRAARLATRCARYGEFAYRVSDLVLGHGDDAVQYLLQVGEGQFGGLRAQPVGDRAVSVLDRPVHPMARLAGPRRCRRPVRVRRRTPWRCGHSALIAVPIPDASPPPLTGTSTLSTSGRSSAISRPIVPCPAMMSGWSNGGTSTPPVCSTTSAATCSRWPGRAEHDLGAVAAGGLDLDRRASPRASRCAPGPVYARPRTPRPARGCRSNRPPRRGSAPIVEVADGVEGAANLERARRPAGSPV